MPPRAIDAPSPVMAQWFAAKEAHPDALLFFRMGDFYELFFADAEAASAALDIALTARGEHQGEKIAMCGVPAHAAEAYLSRLIKRGFRVAIVEQMEAAGQRKGPIPREVVRLVTPGTLFEESLLEAARPNLLLALSRVAGAVGAAWIDVSIGLFETETLQEAALPALLGRLDPAEIVAPDGLALADFARRVANGPAPVPPLSARRRLAEAFGAASLDAFGEFGDAEAVAASLALDYVRTTQAGKLPRLSRPAPTGGRGMLSLDPATRASLEIVRTREGGSEHTLFAAVDRTLTAPGARMLAAWLTAPLAEPAAIASRQSLWLAFDTISERLTRLRAVLRLAPDMARALGRLSLGRGTPRDLAAIRDGMAAASALLPLLAPPLSGDFAPLGAALTLDDGLAARLQAALAETLPARMDDGGAVAPGFDGELDAERALRDDSRRVIATLQLDYAQRYGVASLKIRHHAQLGYVIETQAASAETLRRHPDLTLRQSMANGARFSTAELAELDRRIAEAHERAARREALVLRSLVDSVLASADALSGAADAMALLDVLQSAASLAASGNWCRPVITEDTEFRIEAGRHPVVEAALPAGSGFVSNDCDLSPDRRVLLLTGPNMAGKSTYLRQNALIVILAQSGLPVPARAATIGAVDRLFSRVGAADDLARGRSTFMVEMTETAAILHQAGPRSLVVVDEIGRGTSTLDGLAIAWAVLEALHFSTRCRTIFATHFHELAHLGEALARMRPHTMRVREWKGGVVFLHEVAEGAAGRSWGVHVAELAGVPGPTVRRAASLLARLERGKTSVALDLPLFATATRSESETVAPDEPNTPDALREALSIVEPDRLTPREALDALYRLKSIVAEGALDRSPDAC